MSRLGTLWQDAKKFDQRYDLHVDSRRTEQLLGSTSQTESETEGFGFLGLTPVVLKGPTVFSVSSERHW